MSSIPINAISPVLVLGPALIAGSIGLISAVLSFRSASRSLNYAATADQKRLEHEHDLLITDRRLNAIETIWRALFEMERSQSLSERLRDEVIRAVVWLPDHVGRPVLATIVAFGTSETSNSEIESVRELLLALSKTQKEK